MRGIEAATPVCRLGLPVAVILAAVLALLASACNRSNGPDGPATGADADRDRAGGIRRIPAADAARVLHLPGVRRLALEPLGLQPVVDGQTKSRGGTSSHLHAGTASRAAIPKAVR